MEDFYIYLVLFVFCFIERDNEDIVYFVVVVDDINVYLYIWL